jgi:hypothetical protein
MAHRWTTERLDATWQVTWELLGKDLTEADLPVLRFCLAM